MVDKQKQILSSAGFMFVLMTTVACLFILWIGKFFWEKRKFFRLSSQLPGQTLYEKLVYTLRIFGYFDEVLFEIANTYAKHEVHKLWLGPQFFVVVGDPQWLGIIFNSPLCIDKGGLYEFTKPYLEDGLLTSSLPIWKKHRKLINPSFNNKVLESYVEVFSEQTNILMDILMNKRMETSNTLFDLMSCCLIDIVCETAMGVKVNAQTTDNKIGELQNRVLELGFRRITTVWYHSDILYNFSKLKKETNETVEEMKNFTETVIANKREILLQRLKKLKAGEFFEGEKKIKGFLDLMLESSPEKENVTDEELKDEVNTIITAGSDTTATSTCFCPLTLAMYPEVQAKVYEEIINILGADRDVTPKDIHHFQYLDRVIKESLRIFTPVTFTTRVTSDEIDFNGTIVPSNTNVIINYFNLHRNPKYWKDPLKFDPDRFLPEEVAKRHPYSYVLFAAGPRSCIGSKFAQMAMITVLSTLLRKFEIRTEHKTIEDVNLKTNILLRPVDGFKLSVKLRE